MRHEGNLFTSVGWTPAGGRSARSGRRGMSNASSGESLPDPLSGLRQVSVTQRIDTCDPGPESEERGISNASAVNPTDLPGKIASFGPFRLHATERLLEKNGTALKIGSRALDILLMLLEHAPQVVSKRELIRRVWEELVVDEVSLRFHIAALRKRLADGDSSVSYITNIPGRGYCFTGAVSWAQAQATPRKAGTAASQLPREPLLIVGRDNAIRELTTLLKKQRFVSIVGAGGIGKTTIALTLAHRMLAEFEGVVHFLDLGAVEDARLPASLLASQLGLVAVSKQPLPVILTHLREQRMLLVFDSCEHVIEAIAALSENIFRDASHVHILVTSREALRAEGEQVHHLPPLECPPYTESLTATQALGFPAVQLFVKQVSRSHHAFELTDADAPIVAEICRRLDGIALALELAAARVGVHGVRGTAALLDKQFRLRWRGRRTALPRHQTLSATLDWSYNLLSPTEQLVLRRLAVFVGGFSLEAALDVVAESLGPAELTETLATLVDKSLVTSDRTTATRYRLLDTTRTYAWQKLSESGENLKIVPRHCEHMIHALEQFGATIWALPSPESIDFFVLNLSNVRAAMDWSFSDHGDTGLGAKLAGASACLFFQAGLLPECAAWTERAIEILDTSSKGTRLELELLACFATSFMITRGNVPAVRTALVRALDIAERLNTTPMEQLYFLLALYKWQVRSGDFRGLRELTARIETVTQEISDPAADAIAHAYIANTYYHTGENREVRRHVQIALTAPVHLSKLNQASVWQFRGIQSILAGCLWVLGYPEQAAAMTEEVLQEVENLNQPDVLCYKLIPGVMLYLETGDWQRAEQLIQRLSTVATKHELLTYVRASVGWQGCLAVSRGDLLPGIELLQTALAALHENGYELYRPQLSLTLVEGLAKIGECELAYSTICEAVTWAETRGRVLHLIDLLRVKGEILTWMSEHDPSEGEACLLQSLQLARERGLLSLELRTGISLARLWAARAQRDKALELLDPIFDRFSEGFQTRDLVAAGDLLQQLRSTA
jgi:predicted ATPase/DNA-binding winged helix-turn-helix (wHTH) protein